MTLKLLKQLSIFATLAIALQLLVNHYQASGTQQSHPQALSSITVINNLETKLYETLFAQSDNLLSKLNVDYYSINHEFYIMISHGCTTYSIGRGNVIFTPLLLFMFMLLISAGSFMHKPWYMTFGILTMIILQIIRITAIVWIIGNNFGNYTTIDNWLLTPALYVAAFLLLRLWSDALIPFVLSPGSIRSWFAKFMQTLEKFVDRRIIRS